MWEYLELMFREYKEIAVADLLSKGIIRHNRALFPTPFCRANKTGGSRYKVQGLSSPEWDPGLTMHVPGVSVELPPQ